MVSGIAEERMKRAKNKIYGLYCRRHSKHEKDMTQVQYQLN